MCKTSLTKPTGVVKAAMSAAEPAAKLPSDPASVMSLNYSRDIPAFPKASLTGYFERQTWVRTYTRHLTLEGPLLYYRHSEEEPVAWCVDLREVTVIPGRRPMELRIQKKDDTVVLFASNNTQFRKWFSEIKRVSDSLRNFYRTTVRVGHCGDAEIFFGRDRSMDTNVCIHQIRKGDVKRDIALSRRDAAVIAATDHENIVRILDIFETCTWYYLVTEPAHGRPLSELTLALKQQKSVIKQIVQALLHIHLSGCLHGHIAPENVLVCKHVVKLLVYGYATDRETISTRWSCADDMYQVGVLMRSMGIESGLTKRLLSEDAGKRPSAEDCLKDNWFFILEEISIDDKPRSGLALADVIENVSLALETSDEESPRHSDVAGNVDVSSYAVGL